MESLKLLREPRPAAFRVGFFRTSLLWFFVITLMAVIIGRLLWIQVLHPETLVAASDARVQRSYYYEPPRGLITDRFGKILAISVPVKSVDADPKILHERGIYDDPETLRQIAVLLDIDVESLKEKIRDPSRRFVHLKHYLEEEKATVLTRIAGDGIILNDSYRRYYPTGPVSAALVGILNGEGEGVYGVEQSFNSYLSARAATRVARKDRYNHVIENLRVVNEGASGGNLMLSIDDRLQSYAYSMVENAVRENKADSGTAVLMDVKNGEVLAIVSYPSFDPNERSKFDSTNARNRAVSDIFEPGSTLKPLVALAALEQGTVNWKQVINTLPFKVDGKMVRDSHAMESGTLLDIIKYSSNTGMAHISMKLGPQRIMEMLKRFGFGSRSQSGLAGENAGKLNDNRKFWSSIDMATLGFGYGVAVTSLQLASAYATLANRGLMMPVSLLRQPRAPAGQQIASAAEIGRIQKALETVVAEGTGGQAAIGRYRVAGKTGTAKIAEGGGYSQDYIGTFAGFAPISDPRFALVVVIKAPRAGKFYGGVVSGPVFRDVMSRALQLYNIPPDKQS